MKPAFIILMVVEAYYREHRPGYFIKGLQNGGGTRAAWKGIYRYADFYFALCGPDIWRDSLSGANDVVRARSGGQDDSRETLLTKTFQMADFPKWPQGLDFQEPDVSSTRQRAGPPPFEPRVYWPGQSGDLSCSESSLYSWLKIRSRFSFQQKAADFEAMMPRSFP